MTGRTKAIVLVATTLVLVGGGILILRAGQVPDSGVRGTVTVGPLCPGPPRPTCPDAPLPGAPLEIVRDGRVVARATSDTKGAFTVYLSPGRYVIRPVSFNPPTGPHATIGSRTLDGVSRTVVVESHTLSTVSIGYDTGIR